MGQRHTRGSSAMYQTVILTGPSIHGLPFALETLSRGTCDM